MQNSIWLISFNGNFGHEKLEYHMTKGAVFVHIISIIPSYKNQ